jgi:hypothetical protein
MKPTSVTEEDMERYGKTIDINDEIPNFLKCEPKLREMMIAGAWLAEQLKNLI